MRYHHVFHVSTNELYATPYSYNDDFMEDTIPVCSSFSQRISDDKLARLLTEILKYSNMILFDKVCVENMEFHHFCIRKLYSLEVRLAKVTGKHACMSILLTLNCLPLVVPDKF